MKRFFLAFFPVFFLSAQNPTVESMDAFYNAFLSEGRQSLVEAQTAPPFVPPSPPLSGPQPPPPPPTTPQAIVQQKGYFPVVIRKPANLAASKVHLLSFSPNIVPRPLQPAAAPALYQLQQSFPGQMVVAPVTEATFSPSFSYTLDQFPTSKTGDNDFLLYFPNGIQSVRIYVSIDQPLYCLIGGSPLSLIAPQVFQFNDPNFNTIYDFLELTLTNLPNNQPDTPVQPFMDTSQVDSLGLPFELQIFTYDDQNPTSSMQLIQDKTTTTNSVGYTDAKDTLFTTITGGLTPTDSWGNLVLSFHSNPYDTPFGPPASPFLRILAPKLSSKISSLGVPAQPLGNYEIPTLPATFLTDAGNGAGGISILANLFGYYASPPNLYVQPDKSFNGSGEVYEGVVTGVSPAAVFTFTSTPSNFVITMNENTITVDGMYSGTPIVIGSGGASALDQLLVSAYVSGAFVTGLLGDVSPDPLPFQTSGAPLNAANLQNHIFNPGLVLPKYYAENPLGNPGPPVSANDLFAALLHAEAIKASIPPYPDPQRGNRTPDDTVGLAYAYDYDDKLGISSTVSPNNGTLSTLPIYCRYTLFDVGAAPTGVFDDATVYTLVFEPLPANVTLEVQQGSSGTPIPISSTGQTVPNVTTTSANPFQIRYTAQDGRVVQATLFPKFQFAQPLNFYRQLESGIVLGIKFAPSPLASTAPTTFNITMPGFPAN